MNCEWQPHPLGRYCPNCDSISLGKAAKRSCRTGMPISAPDDRPGDQPAAVGVCRHAEQTEESVECRLCGGRKEAAQLYRCKSPDVPQEFCTMRRVKSGRQYACCLGCKSFAHLGQ